jgi:hypothetical protein
MKKMLAHLLVTLLLISAGTVYAADYYVAPTGSDSNNGSLGSPWATINHADSVVVAGDTVHVLPGTYPESVQMTGASGTANAHITFISDTRWGAVVTGNGSTAPAWQVRTANYVDIVNFEITNSTGYIGIELLAIGDRAIGNLVHDVSGGCTLGQLTLGGAGINMARLTMAYDQEVSGNYIHDIGDPFNPHGCSLTHGIYVEEGTPPAGHFSGKVQNNVIYRVESDGITSYHCVNNMIISNNTVFEAGSSGILVGGSDCSNVNGTIENNIVRHNGFHADCTFPAGPQCPNGKGVHLGNGGILESGSTATNSFKTNLLYDNQRAGVSDNTIALIGGDGSTQSGTISGTDPLFVNYAIEVDAFPGTRLLAGDLHLQSGSPAIDVGTSTNAPATDFNGNSRPQGAGFDIGAYEFVTGSGVMRPTNLSATVK